TRCQGPPPCQMPRLPHPPPSLYRTRSLRLRQRPRTWTRAGASARVERHALTRQQHDLLPLVARFLPRRLEVLPHVGHDVTALGTLKLFAVHLSHTPDG